MVKVLTGALHLPTHYEHERVKRHAKGLIVPAVTVLRRGFKKKIVTSTGELRFDQLYINMTSQWGYPDRMSPEGDIPPGYPHWDVIFVLLYRTFIW